MATRRALLSVSDKTGLVPFAAELVRHGFELISTGGTAQTLRRAGLAVTSVSELTGFPEIMDGRVKTLHPIVHGALLAREGIDEAALTNHGITPIDLLIVNLYPFEQTIARAGVTLAEGIENIDVGGPAMLRAAAKNHERVTVIVDPADYDRVLATLGHGGPELPERRRLATKAFMHTSAYDATIGAWLQRHTETDEAQDLPPRLVIALHRAMPLRYGENPHQQAAVYAPAATSALSIANARQHQGKALSYNNFADADAALRCVLAFTETACVIVKHANPCGVAVGDTTELAYRSAYRTDPTSAFGGVIAFNRRVDEGTAQAIVRQQLVDVIVAPGYDDAALAAFVTRPNSRVLEYDAGLPHDGVPELRSIGGAVLVQQQDVATFDDATVRIVTRRAPGEKELADMRFAWTIVKYVKSNAIVYAGGGATLGIGAGQMSRVMSARVGAIKAAEEGLDLSGSVMASDAFFPFRDSIDTAAEQGVTAVIQPGGSVRDDDVIRAADEHGMAMVFTGLRHFRH